MSVSSSTSFGATTMMQGRTRALFLLLAVGVLLPACGADPSDGVDDTDLSQEAVRALVMDAAAIPKSTMDTIVALGAAVDPAEVSAPLSLALLLVPLDSEAGEDFQWTRGSTTAPKDIAGAFQDLEGDRVSILNPKTITAVTWEAEGRTARGSVRFEIPSTLRGRLQFRADKTEAGWQVVEFSCPPISMKTTRDAAGRWIYTEGD